MSKQAVELIYGTVDAEYTSGLPTVQLDFEDAAAARRYAYLASYTPAAGDRVAILSRADGDKLIIDKVVGS